MATDIREAHGSDAAEERIAGIILVPRARDAQMAVSLVTAGHADGAVLIAGLDMCTVMMVCQSLSPSKR
jgi:hypothetical protein